MQSFKLLLVTIFCSIGTVINAQQATYNVTPGNGNGLRFWSHDAYKIHMGNTAEYKFGPVTDFSIKFNMYNSVGRGWTWGGDGQTPVAALSNTGIFQVALGIGLGAPRPLDMSENGLWLSRSMSPTGGYEAANNTGFHLVEKGWSGSHAILFNSYASKNQVNGSIASLGNTKYKNNRGSYSNGAGAIMFFANSGLMAFYVSDESTGKGTNVDWGLAKMYIERNGNVGIGTANPSHKLEVKDTIKGVEMSLQGIDAWPDYVFAPSYELMQLDQVNDFITKNGQPAQYPISQRSKRKRDPCDGNECQTTGENRRADFTYDKSRKDDQYLN